MQLKPFLKICLSGLLLLTTSVPLQSASTAFFPQSVASGDPRPDRVILWTRVVDLEREGEDLPLTLSVAADPEFASVLVTREGLVARAAHDGCVKVEVPGLAPGTHYWYRFTYRGSETSPVGRTKTAPAPDQPETVRFAFLNCQDYVGRYYNTLAHLVQWEADSLDFIVHLGDYVYETTGDPRFHLPIAIGLDDLGVNVTPAELFPNTRIFRDFHFGAHLQLLLTDSRTFRPDHLIAEDAFPGTIVLEQTVLENWLGAAWSSLRQSLDPYLDIDKTSWGRPSANGWPMGWQPVPPPGRLSPARFRSAPLRSTSPNRPSPCHPSSPMSFVYDSSSTRIIGTVFPKPASR